MVMEGATMLKKLLMAAGLAAAFSLSAQVAEAKLKVHVDIWQPGGYCYYNHDPFRCGGYGYYPRPGYFVPHPGYDYDDGDGYGDRVSCKEARWIVRERGFRDVRTADCGGKYHTFFARKKGGTFRIKIYSRNGRIHSIRSI
jgi:hypothetical protein